MKNSIKGGADKKMSTIARNFYLTNSTTTYENGTFSNYYDLNDIDKSAFFNTPLNLGVEYEIGVIDFVSDLYQSSKKAVFQDIEGELIFKKDSYSEYQKFISFCTDDKLRLVYVLPGSEFPKKIDDKVASCRISLIKCEKSEKDYKIGRIRSKTVFKRLGAWQKKLILSSQESYNQGVRYRADFVLQSNGDYEARTTISNNSDNWAKVNVRMDLTPYKCSDFSFAIKIYGDKEYGRCRFRDPGGTDVITTVDVRHINQTEEVALSSDKGSNWMYYIDYSYAVKGVPFTFITIPPHKKFTFIATIRSEYALTNAKYPYLNITVGESYDCL